MSALRYNVLAPRTHMRGYFLLPIFLGLTAGMAWGQAATSSPPSLGELARAARAQRAQQTTPAPVFTNDNLPRAGDLSVVGQTQPAAAPEPAAGADTTPAADKAKSAEEQKWRARFAAARLKLSDDSRDLSLTQRELNLDQVQYYSNPNQALHQEYSRSDIDRLTARVNTLKAAVAADQAALDELGRELREAGLPPDWGRP